MKIIQYFIPPFIISSVASVTPLRIQESQSVSDVNKIVNVKADQVAQFQFIV